MFHLCQCPNLTLKFMSQVFIIHNLQKQQKTKKTEHVENLGHYKKVMSNTLVH